MSIVTKCSPRCCNISARAAHWICSQLSFAMLNHYFDFVICHANSLYLLHFIFSEFSVLAFCPTVLHYNWVFSYPASCICFRKWRPFRFSKPDIPHVLSRRSNQSWMRGSKRRLHFRGRSTSFSNCVRLNRVFEETSVSIKTWSGP